MNFAEMGERACEARAEEVVEREEKVPSGVWHTLGQYIWLWKDIMKFNKGIM